MGARLPGLPGSCPIELLPPSRSGRAAIAAAPVHHSCSSHPSPALFSWKTSASWVLTGCLRLWILSGNHLWVILPARYPSSASSPSTLVASWSGGSGACLPFFPFPFPFPFESSSLRGQWMGNWNGTSHRVVPLSALGLPCLCSSGGGH